MDAQPALFVICVNRCTFANTMHLLSRYFGLIVHTFKRNFNLFPGLPLGQNKTVLPILPTMQRDIVTR